MAATISTPPPGRDYCLDPLWIEVETDEITLNYGYFEITISSTGPTVGQTLTLTWPGGSITYTVASDISNTGTNWPDIDGGETLEEYTNRIAEFLRHREDVAEVFHVSVEDAPGGVIRMTHRVAEDFALEVTTETMSNVAVTKNDGVAYSPAVNLRAYLEVWTDSGDFSTDRRLAAFHSPYDVATASTEIDISAAFAHLAPALPDPATINPASPPSSLAWAAATGAFQKYYLRYADKYGAPAIAEALLRTEDSYYAIRGSRSLASTATGLAAQQCHDYRRRDGQNFRKPVSTLQPDWVYVFVFSAFSEVWVEIKVYWSDGTDSLYEPFGHTGDDVGDSGVYLFPSGFTQMKLNALTPPGGTDPDAYIVGYDWMLHPVGSGSNTAIARYDVLYDSAWEHYLLFDNGKGGMETVWLRGKASEGYGSDNEEYQRPRQPGHTAQDGDFATYAAAGRPQWEMNTGWYADDFYLDHLRQLPLAQAWLVDRINRRFLKVIVQPGALEDIKKDDETLYSLKFNIKAAWLDTAANV